MKIICMSTLVISWLITRLIIFPLWIIYSIIYDMPLLQPMDLLPNFIVLLKIFLCMLLLMHIYWFYLMIKIIHRTLIKGETLEDDRDENIKTE